MAGERTGKKKRTRTRDVVAEGLYIASAATRLSLKNTILVHILADGEDFDAERYIPEARAALETLREQEAGVDPRADLFAKVRQG